MIHNERTLELDATPEQVWDAELSVEPLGANRSMVKMSMDYRVKYGPFGWLLGQTMMKRVMGKIFDGVLQGLRGKVLHVDTPR